MSVGDRCSDAAKCFLFCSCLFDKIKIEASTLRPPDNGIDMSEQNLLMCSYITKAQAQYCAYDKVKRKAPNKYTMLAKLAMQTSVFYNKAYSLACTPAICRAVDPRTYASVLHFNEFAFAAQANYWMALEYESAVGETMMGIGLAVAYVQKAFDCIMTIKNQEKGLSPAILSQCNVLMKQYSAKKALLDDQNLRLYHEPVPKLTEEIECLQFTHPILVDDELSLPFEGRERLSQLVPRGVRGLEEEYRVRVGGYISQSVQIMNQHDALQEKYLAQYGLPSALHAAFGEQTLPEDVWEKVKQCKEKGGMKILGYIMGSMASFVENAERSLSDMSARLQIEGEEDQEFRAKYGKAAWYRLPSKDLNKGICDQLKYYEQKIVMCKKADDTIKELIKSNRDYLELIEMEREDMIENTPKSSHAEQQPSFVAEKLTGLMKSLGELKKEGENILERMMKTLEGDSVMNDLYQINQGKKDKTKVFEELEQKYTKMQAELEEDIKKRQEVLLQVGDAMQAFAEEKVDDDPARIEVLRTIITVPGSSSETSTRHATCSTSATATCSRVCTFTTS